MQGIFQKENTDKALKYGIYRHLPTYEKIIRNLVSFYVKNKTKYESFLKRVAKMDQYVDNRVEKIRQKRKIGRRCYNEKN